MVTAHKYDVAAPRVLAAPLVLKTPSIPKNSLLGDADSIGGRMADALEVLQVLIGLAQTSATLCCALPRAAIVEGGDAGCGITRRAQAGLTAEEIAKRARRRQISLCPSCCTNPSLSACPLTQLHHQIHT